MGGIVLVLRNRWGAMAAVPWRDKPLSAAAALNAASVQRVERDGEVFSKQLRKPDLPFYLHVLAGVNRLPMDGYNVILVQLGLSRHAWQGEEAETLCRAGAIPILPSKQLSERSLHVPRALETSTCGLLQLRCSPLLGHHLSGASFSYSTVFCPPWCKTSQWIYFPPNRVLAACMAACPAGQLATPVDAKHCLSLTLAPCSASC